MKNLFVGVLFLVAAQLFIQAYPGDPLKPQPKLGKDKIETVIAAMTPAEKIGMSVGDGNCIPATINNERRDNRLFRNIAWKRQIFEFRGAKICWEHAFLDTRN